MTFATWSVRNPLPSVLLFALLSLGGIWAYRGLPVESLPQVEIPTVTITLRQPGAAPVQLETEVARPVEDQLATLEGVKHITTEIRDGEVRLSVEFLLARTLADVLDDSRDALARIRSDLPAELREPEIVADIIDDDPVLTYAVRAPAMSPEDLSWHIDDVVSKAVRGVAGVGRFERLGGADREIRVDLDRARLDALGITVAEVSKALRDGQQDLSGGHVQLGGVERSLRTMGGLRQASELGALSLPLGDRGPVELRQVADIRDSVADPRSVALFDGQPVVGFQVFRSRNADVVGMASRIRQVIEQLSQADGRIAYRLVTDRAAYAREQFDGSMQMLYEGALLAVIVVWCFLRDWRATWIAACALPLSILPTFAALSWLGYTLNTLTLLAVSVVIGILVDDAIVEVENIERHTRMGKSIRQATSDAVSEIALAVTATTMTIVAVFVPTALMGGMPGLFFRQFGWTAVVAVLASLLVARLLTPVMAVHFLRPQSGPEKAPDLTEGRLTTAYLRCAGWCLDHRAATMAAAAMVLAGSLALVPLLSTGLMPSSDEGFSEMAFELPPGSSLSAATAAAEQARQAVAAVPGIAHVFTIVGDGRSIDGLRHGTLTLLFGPPGQRAGRAELERAVRKAVSALPGVRVSLGADQMTLIAAGRDPAVLKATAQTLVRQLRSIPGLGSVTATTALERPEILIEVQARTAAELGVGTADIAETVRLATAGDFDERLSRLSLDQRQLYIRVSVANSSLHDLAALGNLRLAARAGLVPLSSVADLVPGAGPAQIDRYDRQRFVTVRADLDGLSLGDALSLAKGLPVMASLPAGVSFIETGDAEIMGELLSGFGTAILVGLLCMFCVLVLLFRDLLQPLTILSALPLSLGGALLALLATGTELNIPSLIGLVLLMGVVAKNSILLVEYTIAARRDRGLDRRTALIEACAKRARPIVMTTLAMVAGMLPIAFGVSADAGFRQPMAFAVIGGLATSTLLSLLIVPVVFSYVDDVSALARRRRREA